MKATKKEKANQDYNNMSDQKTGSALYIKTHEDFNNEHPEHDGSGLINGNKEAVKTYTCSMHPEVISDKPGKCPKCGMNLIEKK